MILLNGQPVPTTMFPDNTSQVWKLPDTILLASNWTHITWKFSNEGEFLQIAQLKDLLDLYGIRSTLRIKYLPYGRQDKIVANHTTFALTTFAKLLNSLHFEEVIIHDPHSQIALDLISNSKAIYPREHLLNIMSELKVDALCYPDHGAVSKYTKIPELPYVNFPYLYGEKVRDQATGNILSYKVIGNPAGKNILIVDDICDGGMTFKLLAKDLLAAGANEVSLFVTHGIFSKGTRTLFDSGIKRVFTQDGEVSARTSNVQI